MTRSTGSGQAASGVLLPGFAGTALPDWLATRLRDGLAGVCLFGENIVSREQLRGLTDAIRAANPLALIAIDEEGGDVTRLYYDSGSPYPGNAILGRIDDVALTEEVGRTVGWDLVLAGVNLDFAPDVDINSNPDNPVIGVRSFGTRAADVARHAAAWTRGLQSTGVAASAKHFPGHGDTAQDSHLSLPVVDRSLDELRRRELVPFAAAIAAGAKTIMSSHILLPQVDSEPATFSRKVLVDLLRHELGFAGVVVSDALDMIGASGEIGIPRAAVKAVAAGCDLLCVGTGNTDEQLARIETAIGEAVASGELDAGRLDDAAARVRGLAAGLLDAPAEPVPEWRRTEQHVAFASPPTVRAFDIAPGKELSSRIWPVTIETPANIAVGSAPWGPFANGWSKRGQVVREGDAIVPPPEGAQLVLIGRDNHRYGWVRALVDGARVQHPDVVVIDMGWPSDDRAYADIATFGASRHVGEALRYIGAEEF